MERFIDLSGGPVHVTETGEGEQTWLLVHGLAASAATWIMLAPRLPGRVIAVDLPGFGISPPWRGDPLRAFHEVIVEVIEEVVSNDAETRRQQVHFVGNSMGALIGAEVAGLRPDLIADLVMIAPATSMPPGQELREVGGGFAAFRSAVRNGRSSPARRVDALLELTMVDPARVPIDVREQLIDAAALHVSHLWAWPALLRTGASLYARLLRRPAFIEMIREVGCPTLVIWGQDDVLVRPVSMRWLIDLRPDWRSIPFAETGHAPMLERPEKTAKTILEWNKPGGSRGKGLPRERRA